MKIDFYIAKDETIPTKLRLKVDDTIDVYYEPLEVAFGWKFDFFKFQGVTYEMAENIVNEIVCKMINQSYDHGAQWREHGERIVVNDDFELSFTVFFRVRDAG